MSAWSTPLRHHGKFWGRPAKVTREADTLVAHYGDDRYLFRHTIALRDHSLHTQRQVINQSEQSLPFMWGQHLPLNVENTNSLEPVGTDEVDRAYLRHKGEVLDPRNFSRMIQTRVCQDLSKTHPVSAEFATKLLAKLTTKFAARLTGRNCQISMY